MLTAKAAAPDTTIQQAERQLLDGVARILRNPGNTGWMLLVLHLSRIAPPGPKAHHRRVAGAMLEDTAGRTTGQLFSLTNGDMVLLFRPTDDGVAIAGVIARLFQTDVPNPETLRTLWLLPGAARDALDYVRARAAEGLAAAPPPEPQSNAGAIAAMDSLVQTAALGNLMHRQTAVLLRPKNAEPVTALFREVSISTAVLEARIDGKASADPFLFNHLAARLDRRMLAALVSDIPAGGPLSSGLGLAALHVNLTMSGILSDGFASFADACQGAIGNGLRIAIELPFVEVFADSKAFILARERLRLARMRLVLDGMTHHALLITSAQELRADLVKLNWSPELRDAGPDMQEAVNRLGVEQIVLHRCDSQAALTWGLKHGIERFQGFYLDQLLAASRLSVCRNATACTLRQCSERASATGPAGRSGCGNVSLLDGGAAQKGATLRTAAPVAG